MRIGLLGTLSVRGEAGQPVRVGGHRVRMLLILLALDAGRVVPVYSLIERLWADDPPANAGNSLQSLVSRLRASLRQAGLPADIIESHPSGYRLAISPHEVDAKVFESLAREGSAAFASGDAQTAAHTLKEALAAWRGPALADAAGEDFAAGPAARLEELRDTVAQDLIEARLHLGEGGSLIGELRAMVAADPMAERPRGLLMRALYAAGRQADALAVYQASRELLDTRLGVSPSPELERLYLAILRQDLPEAPVGLPARGAVPAARQAPGETRAPPTGPDRTQAPAAPSDEATGSAARGAPATAAGGHPAPAPTGSPASTDSETPGDASGEVLRPGPSATPDPAGPGTLAPGTAAAPGADASHIPASSPAEPPASAYGRTTASASGAVGSTPGPAGAAAGAPGPAPGAPGPDSATHGSKPGTASSGSAGVSRSAGPPFPAGPTSSEQHPGLTAFVGKPRVVGVRKTLTSFVGRDEDVVRVLKMLGEGRLVTLTGPGGAGKTRLAAESAALLAATTKARGVWFVELAPLTEPAEVPFAVLSTLGIHDGPVMGGPGAVRPDTPADPVERLVSALDGQESVLILDNCEHVVTVAAALADHLLANCSQTRILATSREPLRIAGEVLWPVPPLPVPPSEPGEPPPAGLLSASTPGGAAGRAARDDAVQPGRYAPGESSPGDSSRIAGYASVRLLQDRAAAVRPGFQVDANNAAAVTRICRALDGMPLAIELAAARLRTLSADQLAERLGARFDLLTGGSRTAMRRHQTLRAVVDWSWELLSEPEQVLARRLAVFPGGATLAAAERVCADGGPRPGGPAAELLPALFGLVDKSFLSAGGEADPRYRMLETVRAYCLERLTEAGEEHPVRLAFADYFLELVVTADPLLRGRQQATWMRRLSAEQDNIHAALRWAIEHRDVATALQFGQGLGWYWMLRGQRRETAVLARDILRVSDPLAAAGGGPGLCGQAGAQTPEGGPVGGQAAPGGQASPVAMGSAAWVQARAICALTAAGPDWDLDDLREPLTAGVALVEASPSGDTGLHPLVVLGCAILAIYDGRPERGAKVLDDFSRSADPWTSAASRLLRGSFTRAYADGDDPAHDYASALEGFQAIGDSWGRAMALAALAEIASVSGEHSQAIAALQEAAQATRAMGSWEEGAQILASLARCRVRAGDYQGAVADLEAAERAFHDQGTPWYAVWLGFIRAELAFHYSDFDRARDLCAKLDEQLSNKTSVMHWSFRAMIGVRGALADVRAGNVTAGRAALAKALRLAVDGHDRTIISSAMDSVAAAVLAGGTGPQEAEQAAAVLGAAHSIRGMFDHGSLDAPGARDTARAVLGDEAFEAAYQRGRALGLDDAVSFALSAVRPASPAGPGSGPAAVRAHRERGEHHKDPQRPQH